jgi:hypothetical protein
VRYRAPHRNWSRKRRLAAGVGRARGARCMELRGVAGGASARVQARWACVGQVPSGRARYTFASAPRPGATHARAWRAVGLSTPPRVARTSAQMRLMKWTWRLALGRAESRRLRGRRQERRERGWRRVAHLVAREPRAGEVAAATSAIRNCPATSTHREGRS